MPRTTPRLTETDLNALRALASGRNDIAPVSRYWLSVYELIDESPAGWHVTARGRALLEQPVVETRYEALAADDPRVLAAAVAAANAGNPPGQRIPRRRAKRRLPWAGEQP